MRIVTAVLIWVALVGGFYFYQQARERIQPAAPQFEQAAAMARYELEVTPAFSGEVDPFVLDSDAASASLRVRLNGEVVFAREEGFAAGEVMKAAAVSGVKIGENEFFVEASPPILESERAHALRLRLFRGEAVLLDKTLWAAPGERIASPVSVVVQEQEEVREDEHGH